MLETRQDVEGKVAGIQFQPQLERRPDAPPLALGLNASANPSKPPKQSLESLAQ